MGDIEFSDLLYRFLVSEMKRNATEDPGYLVFPRLARPTPGIPQLAGEGQAPEES